MSNYNKLLKNIEEAENDIMKSSDFDIIGQLLSNEEIVKNIIKAENPNMTKEDIDIMVDGFGQSSKTEAEIDSLKDDLDTPYKRKVAGDKIKEEKSKQKPLSKDSPFYKKAMEIKSIIVEKILEFIRKVKELIRDISLAGISIIQSIPGSVLLLAPFAFNLPGMITMLISVVLTMLMIKSKFMDVKSIFPAFKNINLVLSGSGLEKTSAVLNALYNTLFGSISGFIKGIDDFIKKVFSALKNNNTSEKEAKRVRAITRKLRKLKYLPKNNYDDVNEDDGDEVEIILEEWEVFNRTSRTNAVRKRKEKQDEIDRAFSELEKVENINDQLKELTNIVSVVVENQDLVYDVELPNGEKLFGLTLEELDSLKEKYTIVFS